MTWYYAIGNERQGPVDDAELDRLIASRTITPETLVWRAGMADWQPLAQARPQVARPAPPPPAPLPAPIPTPTPMTPVSTTPTPSVTDPATQPKFGASTTFGTPGFGTPPGSAPSEPAGYGGAAGAGYGVGSTMGATPSEDPAAMLERISRSGRRVAIGDALSRAWQLVSANFGLAVGTTFVVMVAIGIAGAIPCIGFFVSLVVRPVLLGGMFIFFLKLLRNQNAEFGDAFSGFSVAFLPLFLQGLVTLLLTLLVMAPGGVLAVIGAGLADNYRTETLGGLFMVLGILVTLPPLLYVSVIWIFSLPLIVDKRMDFWPAMELSRKVAQRYFFPIVGLLIVCGLMMFAGLLALCLGIFIAAPIAFAAITIVYEDLFAA